ncbi:MAG: hypothetical protein LBS52_05805 [Dysgonamonadaceae bacterium]|nr:hypothetical protein [Dysgonamonadaceae bacterium]
MKKMQRDLDKKIKQKAKLEYEIDELTKQISSQNLLLNQQNEDLRKISNYFFFRKGAVSKAKKGMSSLRA